MLTAMGMISVKNAMSTFNLMWLLAGTKYSTFSSVI